MCSSSVEQSAVPGSDCAGFPLWPLLCCKVMRPDCILAASVQCSIQIFNRLIVIKKFTSRQSDKEVLSLPTLFVHQLIFLN